MKFTYQNLKGLMCAVFFSFLSAQTSYPPPTSLITAPTAGTLVRGSFALETRIQKNGALTSGLSVGITDRFQFGLSYGGGNIIGDDSLKWHPRPEANLKYRLVDEDLTMPGISIGINTQGYGMFNEGDSLNRYDVKAYGAFVSLSKNWATPLGNLGLHAGANHSFLETDSIRNFRSSANTMPQ